MCNRIEIIQDKIIIHHEENLMDDMCPDFIRKTSNKLASNINTNNIIYDFNIKCDKLVYVFNTNTYIYYKINDKWYVDLNHILSNMNLSDDKFIYYNNKFFNYTKICIWMIKNNGTYILRDLLNLESMCAIILSFDCEFSRNFKLECINYFMAIYTVYCYLFYIILTYYSIINN
ncbi:hypothetical protein QLL95_gp0788 [Cotonvirus japonicus]|uniref:Uncharacterized protein n=1 Tax=Cotonvirus japonicus TaxID=2811091 RepID=A0ABM7NT37_9VIRU|nr:hypothetical protein QLL95_gp0788 [Cotonvirus japonicus]BCS83335.1 hypothetical protein [Cotonvirus japonicus]